MEEKEKNKLTSQDFLGATLDSIDLVYDKHAEPEEWEVSTLDEIIFRFSANKSIILTCILDTAEVAIEFVKNYTQPPKAIIATGLLQRYQGKKLAADWEGFSAKNYLDVYMLGFQELNHHIIVFAGGIGFTVLETSLAEPKKFIKARNTKLRGETAQLPIENFFITRLGSIELVYEQAGVGQKTNKLRKLVFRFRRSKAIVVELSAAGNMLQISILRYYAKASTGVIPVDLHERYKGQQLGFTWECFNPLLELDGYMVSFETSELEPSLLILLNNNHLQIFQAVRVEDEELQGLKVISRTRSQI